MSTMMLTANWMIDVRFEEDPNHTVATASLRMPNGRELRATGRARRNPGDRPVAAIGEEIACARALSQLTHAMLDFAADEVEVNVHRGDPVP
ncbi:DUF1876 domain-containing protein [Stackebrandtia soli]|uniref:DUF1876 domain-containing protein n=1 Tax=Stackebrandtia soli TaxID=1892856 RepID=UPI0039E95326